MEAGARTGLHAAGYRGGVKRCKDKEREKKWTGTHPSVKCLDGCVSASVSGIRRAGRYL